MRSSWSRRALRRALAAGAVATVAACAANPGGELEPRYVAVHNALAAMGLAQVGPIQRGSLAAGREARLPLELPAQCTTIVALGGSGVADLDASLLDPDGQPVAHDTTKDPQAVVRACVDRPGVYTLVVRMAAGAGDFALATWTGGVGAGPAAPAGPASATAAMAHGTCDSPIPLVAGSLNASTAHGEAEQEGSCASSGSRELVYKLDLPSRQRVTIEVDPRFDAVLYVRKDECGDAEAEVACNDDVGHERKSRIDEVFEPGTYYVFVDGYASESGAFHMTVALADTPTLAEVCQRARPLASGLPNLGTTGGSFDFAHASCGDSAKGPDNVHRLDVSQRSRVRVVLHSDEFAPVVHLRRACADEASEIGCANTGGTDDDAAFVSVLDPGSYAVFVDGAEREASGRYSLSAEVAPEQGSVAPGDACADALPLASAGDRAATGDTFLARDDFAGKCGGAGAADVVYKVEVPRRSRVSARFTRQEGRHVFVLLRTCADRASELACGVNVDEVLAPGTYFLAVDGVREGSMGRFTFDFHVREVASQEGACRAAPLLVAGQTVTGSTAGAGDKFTTSCGGREDTQTSPDRAYRLVLTKRTHLRLTLATPAWDGVLAIRKTCLETPGPTGVRTAEAACNNDSDDTHHARIDTTLDAGSYVVIVDGHASGNEGAFTLDYKTL
jgi:hypothetical protein